MHYGSSQDVTPINYEPVALLGCLSLTVSLGEIFEPKVRDERLSEYHQDQIILFLQRRALCSKHEVPNVTSLQG